jgi:hypothetical protein
VALRALGLRSPEEESESFLRAQAEISVLRDQMNREFFEQLRQSLEQSESGEPPLRTRRHTPPG